MPKLTVILRSFSNAFTELRLILVLVLYFSAGARKCAGEKGTGKAFDYSDIKRCFDYLSS